MRTAAAIAIVLGGAVFLVTPSGRAQKAVALKPDLVCTARALIGPNAIANGASVNGTGFNADVLGKNQGLAPSNKVTGMVQVFKNGTQLTGFGTWGTKTLAAGESKPLVHVAASVPSYLKGSYKMVVRGVIDANKQVAETKEDNNECLLWFTLNVK
jgi:subtilase family serine protease